jgi:hypothetical protein
MRRVLVTDDDGAVLRYFLVLLTQSQRYETMVLSPAFLIASKQCAFLPTKADQPLLLGLILRDVVVESDHAAVFFATTSFTTRRRVSDTASRTASAVRQVGPGLGLSPLAPGRRSRGENQRFSRESGISWVAES